MIQRTLFLMVLCPLGLALAEDWPQWCGPDRTAVSNETGLLQSWPATGPNLLWTFRDAGAGYSCMSVVGNRLYTMGIESNKDCVFALDLNTRKKLWSTEVGARYQSEEFCDGPMSTPTIDGNFLYAIGGRGDLVCVERASGKKVWTQSLQTMGGASSPLHPGYFWYGYSESPLVDGDQVVASPGGQKGALAAFDKKTGALKWRSTPGIHRDSVWYASMIAIEVGGVRQYVQRSHEGGYLIGVRASDGKLLWEVRDDHFGGTTTPIFHSDSVYVSSPGSCHLVKLMADGSKFKAEQIYSNKEMRNYHGGVILVGEHLYGYSDASGWICQEFKTGKTRWKKNPRLGRGSITFTDGKLLCYHENKGDVLLIKATPAGYQEQGRFRIPEQSKLPRKSGKIWTHPVVANGKLYLRDQDLIFCCDIHKPLSVPK